MNNINGIVKISDIQRVTGLTRRNVIAICSENNVNVACANGRYYIDGNDYVRAFNNGCCNKLKEVNEKQKIKSKTTGNGSKKFFGKKRINDLTREQLKRREEDRKQHPKINDEMKGYAVLVFVSEYAKQLPYRTYVKERDKAYKRQMYRAYTGIKGDKKETNFIYDIDLERMIECGYEQKGVPMERWWDGTIRHWTVNDGVWKNKR